MPKVSVNVDHNLGQEQALQRLKEFLPKLRDKFQGQVSDLEEAWEGSNLNFSFKTFGFKIKGLLNVDDKEVKLAQDLPLTAMMFKGKIEEAVRTELQKLLA